MYSKKNSIPWPADCSNNTLLPFYNEVRKYLLIRRRMTTRPNIPQTGGSWVRNRALCISLLCLRIRSLSICIHFAKMMDSFHSFSLRIIYNISTSTAC